MLPAIRDAIAAVDPHVPTYDVSTMEDHVRQAVGPAVTTAVYVATLGLLGLLLAALGVYGVISYSVIQRTREIGVRMSLGAAPRAVLVLILKQGAGVFGLGLAVGLAGTVGAARMLHRFLYGVEYDDPMTFAVATTITAGVSFVAVFLPAWKATRVDPLAALRAE
jgi:ABC-type antimicrobial peptide transport system permease subunit